MGKAVALLSVMVFWMASAYLARPGNVERRRRHLPLRQRRCDVLLAAPLADGENVTEALVAVSAELASCSARRTVVCSSERKLRLAYERRAEAERLLKLALEEVRSTLRSEMDSALDREAELTRTLHEYERWETAKRTRAATERELMASLASVASLTPEAEIADKLCAVADAKAEIIAVDSALADEFAEAVQKLKSASHAAKIDTDCIQSALDSLPLPDADPSDVRAFDWKPLDAARDRVQNAQGRATSAIDDARRLDAVIDQSMNLRAKAVDIADPDRDDDLPPFSEAAKEVAAAGLETAAAFGDWVLSDGPEEFARDIAGRLRARVS